MVVYGACLSILGTGQWHSYAPQPCRLQWTRGLEGRVDGCQIFKLIILQTSLRQRDYHF